MKNTGTKGSTIKMDLTAPNWVTVIPKNIELGSKETGEFFLYYNPAMDMKDGNYAVKVTLKGEDFYKVYNIEAVISAVDSFVEQAVKIESSVKEITSDNKITAMIVLTNDSNTNVLVKSISTDLNALFEPASIIVPKNSTKEVKATIYLSEMHDLVKLPLKIETDKGLIEKELEINTKTKDILSVGLISLLPEGNIFTLPLLAAIIVTILVIFVFYRKASKAERDNSNN